MRNYNRKLWSICSSNSLTFNRNAELQSKVKELEEQIDHLQETLAALQAEHADFQDQLQQRNLALTVQSGSPAKDTYSEEKIAELVREIDRCLKLLSA